jgi:hypothetical protein
VEIVADIAFIVLNSTTIIGGWLIGKAIAFLLRDAIAFLVESSIVGRAVQWAAYSFW